MYERYLLVAHPSDMRRFEDEMSTRRDYIDAFRNGDAYHPFHASSMLYMGDIALDRASSIVIAGAESADHARGMGCVPVATFDDAVDRVRDDLGHDPRMLVIPALSKPRVHLRAGD